MASKYGNIKIEYDGKVFDSRKEGRRYAQLRILEMAGEIENIRCQVPFELIPAQYEPDIVGKRGGVKRGKCLERSVVYYADFVYRDKRTGETIVEDVKSSATRKKESYIIKRKLMLFIHRIKVVEV